jgi:hypothetical protein
MGGEKTKMRTLESRKSAVLGQNTVQALARWMLALVMGAAGLVKLADPLAFRQAVAAYELVPEAGLSVVVWGVPALELVLAGALAGPWRSPWHQAGALLAFGLLAGFTLAIGVAWSRGLEIQCGCFGSALDFGSPPLWIARNAVLMAMAAWVGRTRSADICSLL